MSVDKVCIESVAVAVVYTSRCECECNGYEQTSVCIWYVYIICMWIYILLMNVF